MGSLTSVMKMATSARGIRKFVSAAWRGSRPPTPGVSMIERPPLRVSSGSSISIKIVLSISSAVPTVKSSRLSMSITSCCIWPKSPKYRVALALGPYLMTDATDVQMSVSVGQRPLPSRALINVDLPRLNSPHTSTVTGFLPTASSDVLMALSCSSFPGCLEWQGYRRDDIAKVCDALLKFLIVHCDSCLIYKGTLFLHFSQQINKTFCHFPSL